MWESTFFQKVSIRNTHNVQYFMPYGQNKMAWLLQKEILLTYSSWLTPEQGNFKYRRLFFWILYNYLYDINQSYKTVDLCLDFDTDLEKVEWKIGSCLCSRSPFFITLMLFKGRTSCNTTCPQCCQRSCENKIRYNIWLPRESSSWFGHSTAASYFATQVEDLHIEFSVSLSVPR